MRTTIRKREKEVVSENEPLVKKKDHLMYVRLPFAVSERLKRQSKRLSCSMNMLTRMALVKYLEEEESKRPNTQS
jgi:hypothetical protein